MKSLLLVFLLLSGLSRLATGADAPTPSSRLGNRDLAANVRQVVSPLMERDGIPGMAVGVTADGLRRVFTFGVSSLATRQAVSADTLFEVGSVTKTFTATLAALAIEKGVLRLSDPVERYLPELRGTPFGSVKVVQLATHTPGGLPLQVPDSVHSMDELTAYFRAWKPTGVPGSIRTYSNVSVGALGWVAARSLGGDFGSLLEKDVLEGLGLGHTHLHVPADRLAFYAQGYTGEGAPVRLTAGLLWEEGYGIRTTADDLLTFLDENMGILAIRDPLLFRALRATHVGYVRAGPMIQDLMWEAYPTPASLETLLRGNSEETLYHRVPAVALVPPLSTDSGVLINKTGSTAGFGAYVLFVPLEQVGVVLLANKTYPLADRVRAGYAILEAVRRGGR